MLKKLKIFLTYILLYKNRDNFEILRIAKNINNIIVKMNVYVGPMNNFKFSNDGNPIVLKYDDVRLINVKTSLVRY